MCILIIASAWDFKQYISLSICPSLCVCESMLRSGMYMSIRVLRSMFVCVCICVHEQKEKQDLLCFCVRKPQLVLVSTMRSGGWSLRNQK